MTKYAPLAKRSNIVYSIYRIDDVTVFGVIHSFDECKRLSMSKSTLSRLYRKTNKTIQCKCGNIK